MATKSHPLPRPTRSRRKARSDLADNNKASVDAVDKVQEALEESFPCSDPPSWTVRRVGRPPHSEDK
jgi:hypothetical protein